MQLVVGRIRRPHGIRGDVTVEVRTDEPDRRFVVGSVLATDPAERGPLTLTASRWHSGSLLLTFAEIADRDEAEELRGTWLVVDSADLGPTGDPDEFYDHELIGLAAVTVDGAPVGVVTDVLHHGQDLLVIAPSSPDGAAPGPDGAVPGLDGAVPGLDGAAPGLGGAAPGPGAARQAQVLVPFVSAIVPEVDVPAGRLVIDPPPGLLDP